MELRDKLAEIIRNAHFAAHPAMQFGYPEADALIRAGVILPPCKVGDTVYQTDGERVYESVVKNVIYDTDGIAFDETAIGKVVFLYVEEAEIAKRRLENRKDCSS